MTDNPNIQSLLHAFELIGNKTPVWTQAQGSNLSFKDTRSRRMYIKPSGFRLDQVKQFADLVELDLESLEKGMTTFLENKKKDFFDQDYAKVINDSKIGPENKLRPSMETGFHFVLKNDFVFHFHALAAIVMGFYFEKKRKEILDFLSRTTNLSVNFIDYATPGLDLTVLLRAHAYSNVLLLKNHGVILNSNDPNILNEWQKIESNFCKEFLDDDKLVSFRTGNVKVEDLKPIPIKILFPDFAVFLNRLMGCLLKNTTDARNSYSFNPALIEKEKDMYEVWVSYWLIYSRCPELNTLSDEEVKKICDLPTEQFRLMMNSK